MVSKMRRIIIGALTVLTLCAVTWAQDRLPVRDYTPPDEIITLSADMTFVEAFEILSAIAEEKDGKIIIDPAHRQGRIDVQITNLHWKTAFEVILKAHRLTYKEHEKFYEVVGEGEKVATDEDAITLSSREVRIHAIFFEADRGALAEAGIDWLFSPSTTSITETSFGVNGATAVSDEIVEGTFNYGSGSDGVWYDVTGMFRAFESDNLGRILAQPEVIVISGREGRIQVGQDFSIKTRDFAGNVIDNFFSTGTILTVTPVVIAEDDINFIHLRIAAERSSATPDPVSTIINKSQAQTEVILVDGESTTVGGLFSREYTTLRKGIPGLKDLPWWFLGLRYLFGYNLKDVSDKELIVVLTASLVPELRVRSLDTVKPNNSEIFKDTRKKSQEDIDRHWEKGVDEVDGK